MVALIFTMFAIRTSWFQTWLAQQASAYFSKEFGTEVSIEKVDIKFVDRVDLEGVYLEDVKKDTFIYTDVIHADISDWSFFDPMVAVSSATLEGGHVHIRKYEGDENLNFQHIVDYFEPEEEDTTASEFDLSVAKFILDDIHFIYEDQNAEPTENGLDFSNIELTHLNGGFSNFQLDGPNFAVSLDDLSFTDKSGLSLNKLSGDFSFSPELMALNNLQIGINNSFIQGDYLEFHTPNGGEDFSDFTNKVRINSHLKNSTLYLQDLAYFVPDLWGLQGKLAINNLETVGAVYGMHVNNVDLAFMDTTRILGDFMIPDLSDIRSSIFQEDLTYFRTSVSDIEKMHLDRILNAEQTKTLDDALAQYAPANIVELKNGSFIGGLESFVVDGDLYSGIGNVHLEYGLQFTWDEEEELYFYKGPELQLGQIKVEDLDIGVIAQSPEIGKVTGIVKVEGKGFDKETLDLSFAGGFDRVGVLGNTYHDVKVKEGTYANNIFDGVVTIGDDNLALEYDGSVNLNEPMFFDFEVRVDSAQVGYLAQSEQQFYQKLVSKIKVQVEGTSVNEIKGSIVIEDFMYQDTANALVMEKMTVDVFRHPDDDSIIVNSPFFDLELVGKYDLEDVGHALTEQFSYVINNIVEDQHDHDADHEHYFLFLTLKDIDPLLEFFDDDISVAPNSIVRSEFDHDTKNFVMDVNSAYVEYHGTRFEEIKIENHFDSLKAILSYSADYVQVTDSLAVRNFVFDSRCKDNKFVTMTGWDGVDQTEPALFAFETGISENHDILTIFRPSFFFLKGHKYDVQRNSSIMYNEDKIVFHDFKISHKDNYIGLEGLISKDPDDWLNITVRDFDLADLNGMIGETVELGGILNVDGKLGNVYDVPKFNAESSASELTLDGYLVGDLQVFTDWVEEKSAIQAHGKLLRGDEITFAFSGNYFTKRSQDNLDFAAVFDQTDIGFLNAFEDPELYTEIAGIVDGEITIKGELDNPMVEGEMDVLSSSVTIPMFNIGVGATGTIEFFDGEIIAEHLRIEDQEENFADCQMFIYHFGWEDWNYNVHLDMENPLVSDKFLAMNTTYKEGDSYYGKAYVNGSVNIDGYDDHTNINVDVTTKEGTSLVLPMYGSSELEEGNFIIFDEEFFLPDSLKTNGINEELKKVNRYGVTLDMDFHVTKDAEVKIVFDPVLEDQIVSKGEGNLEIDMNDFGDLSMRGEYVIRDGRYEMRVKQIVEEDFVLENGGTVRWTGEMEDADIEINALFTRVVTLAEIMPPEAAVRRKKEDVYGVLSMTNTLMNPVLAFDIVAPKTDDLGQKAINEIKADQDELNKQFFALLILKRFLPRYGGAAGGGDAILGLAETQINSVLDGISDNYSIKAGLTETSTTLGLETKLNDRTTIKTSFGVLANENTPNGSQLVGDVDIEYRLNDDGTFTMNFFNETNSSSITSQGNYTQGISLHYQETFNTTKQFRMWQKFLNMFRKKENRVIFEENNRRSDKWVPIPSDSTSTDTTTTGLIYYE